MLASAAALGAAGRKPNLIVILADDFGNECVSANGGQSYQTPNLDRLAATGMRFENCHVQPVCTPTRIEVMTGIYNVRNYTKFGVIDAKEINYGETDYGPKVVNDFALDFITRQKDRPFFL